MSSSTSTPVVNADMLLIPLGAVAAAAYGAGYAAYQLLVHLRDEHHRALAQYRAPARSQFTADANQHLREPSAAAPASSAADGQPPSEPYRAFLRSAAARLTQRAAKMNAAASLERCAQLQEAAENLDVADSEVLEQYIEVSADIRDTRVARATTSTEIAAGIEMLRLELATPLLSGPSYRALREQLADQLNWMERLPPSEIATARESLRTVELRLERELRQRKRTIHLAERLPEALAKLRALQTAAPNLPDGQEAAAVFQELLNLPPQARSFATVSRLVDRANSLYVAFEADLRRQAIEGYILTQATEAVQSLGYETTWVAANGDVGFDTLLVTLDHQIGVEFWADQSGYLHTELVNLKRCEQQPEISTQEEACDFIDQVLARFAERTGSEIPESERHYLQPGKQLRTRDECRTALTRQRTRESAPALKEANIRP